MVGTILAKKISTGRAGLTSSCSTVPRSFSRTRLAAVSSSDTIVHMLSSSNSPANQALSMFGLNVTRRRSSSVGPASRTASPARRSITSTE